jgi:hypothetical protein
MKTEARNTICLFAILTTALVPAASRSTVLPLRGMIQNNLPFFEHFDLGTHLLYFKPIAMSWLAIFLLLMIN